MYLGKLKEGVTFNRVLDAIREAEISPDTFNRSCLLERQDLYNIARDFNIDYATKRDSNDSISVKLWVTEMKSHEAECPVLYYKNQNESVSYLDKADFALVLMTNFQAQQIIKFGSEKICIDGTHGTNAYDIQLYTLLTVDEFGSGCPVAFCFSNRSDELIFRQFFNVVKSKVGQIQSKVFMSDDAPAFYNAWSSVMGAVTHKLLCTWHIDRNWRQNLNKISGVTEKKAIVYKTLRVLLQQTSVEDFQTYHVQVLEDLLNDNDTKLFGEYFKRHYSNRPESWAYCYRLRLGINTNMYLESFHKTLKHIYLEGKKVKRLDKTINAVMKFTRDSIFQRLIKLSKNVPCEKVQKIRQSHTVSMAFKLDQIQILKNEEGYLIQSQSNPSLQHHIVKVGETCNHPSCLKCIKCNICVHTFHCSCMDNLIKLNICKHIHACARLIFNSFDDKENNVETNLAEQENAIKMAQTFVQFKAIPDNNEDITSQAKLILGLSTTCSYSDSQKELIKKQLAKVISLMNEGKKVTFNQLKTLTFRRKLSHKIGFTLRKKKQQPKIIFKNLQ